MKAYIAAIIIGLFVSFVPLFSAQHEYESVQGPRPTKPVGTTKGPSPLTDEQQMALMQKMGLSDKHNAPDNQNVGLEQEEETEGVE